MLDAAEPCPTCGNPYGAILQFMLPEFGFVADRTARDVGTAPPERRWHGASFVENVGDEATGMATAQLSPGVRPPEFRLSQDRRSA